MDDFTRFLFETGLIINIAEDKKNDEISNTHFFGRDFLEKDFYEFGNADEDEECLNEDY